MEIGCVTWFNPIARKRGTRSDASSDTDERDIRTPRHVEPGVRVNIGHRVQCRPGARRASRMVAAMSLLACVLSLSAETSARVVSTALETSDAARSVAVLAYHRFADAADDSMTVSVAAFEAQLRFLRDHGYEIVPLRRIVAWLRTPDTTLPPKAVALTVDDGHRSVYERLLPIIRREQLPVTLFIYPSAISNATYALTWQQLREMRATGLVDVQSHTWWHPNFNVERRRLSASEYTRFATSQLQHSRELIESKIGGHVDMIAWPFGVYDDEVLRLASSAGYVAGFTLDARRVERSALPLTLPRLLMVEDVTPRVLGRLLGEREGSPSNATGQRR